MVRLQSLGQFQANPLHTFIWVAGEIAHQADTQRASKLLVDITIRLGYATIIQ
jgi:hypothetical protein